VVYQQDGGWLFAIASAGGSPTPVVMDSSTYPKLPRLSGDGSWVVYESDSIGGQHQAFVARTDGTQVTRISGYPLWDPRPDISADGTRVAFNGWDGTPNYYYQDLWLYAPQASTWDALTEYFNAADTRISGDGEYVYFLPVTSYPYDLSRMRISTGQMKSFAGFSDPRAAKVFPASPGSDTAYQVDHTGRVVLSWPGNWTGENPDLNQEIWIIDPDATPRWDIESTAPARIRFTPEPGECALHYDLIRGDLRNLAPGIGGTVELGEVVCLLDGLPTTTVVDPEGPAPSQGFFYLYGVAGNWGASSSGAPRVAGSGDCP